MNIDFDMFTIECNISTLKECLKTFIKDKFNDLNEPFTVHGNETWYIHIKINEQDRMIGNIISPKNIKTFATMKNNKFNTLEFDPNTSPIDFNYFIIDLKKKIGLYMSYRGSTSFYTFSYFLYTLYKNYIDNIKDEIKSKSLSKKQTREEMNKIKNEHGIIKVELMSSTIPFIEKVRELNSVTSVVFDIAFIKNGAFTTLEPYMNTKRLSFSLKRKINVKGLVLDALTDFINMLKKEDKTIFLSVSGKDALGNTWTYNYKKLIEKIEKIGYDKAVALIATEYLYSLDNRLVERMHNILDHSNA